MMVIAWSCSKIDINEVKNSILITRCELSPPNSVGGCDVTIGIKNISGKSIKYINLYMEFYNAVGDKVPCEIRGYGYWGEITGYIQPNAETDYTWDCPIYNYSAKNVKVTEVIIEYDDGSKIEIAEDYVKYLYK